jgi:hypothetical protein
METIKITKKHNGLKPGMVITVTTMTAAKRVADGLAEYLEKPEAILVPDGASANDIVEKEDKVVFETKEEKVEGKKKRTIKAPK